MKRPVAKISNHSRRLATLASDVIDHSRRLAKVANLRFASSLKAPLVFFSGKHVTSDSMFIMTTQQAQVELNYTIKTIQCACCTRVHAQLHMPLLHFPYHWWNNLVCDIYLRTSVCKSQSRVSA